MSRVSIGMLGKLVIVAALVTPAAASPKVATQAWLREFPKWNLDTLIDADQGLAMLVRRVDTASEDDRGHESSERLCGPQLAKHLPPLRSKIVESLKHSDTTSCHNKPRPAYCAFGVSADYTTFRYLVFRPTATGDLRLDAVLVLDAGSMSDEGYAKQTDWVSKQLTKLRSTDCNGEPVKPPSYEGFVDVRHAP